MSSYVAVVLVRKIIFYTFNLNSLTYSTPICLRGQKLGLSHCYVQLLPETFYNCVVVLNCVHVSLQILPFPSMTLQPMMVVSVSSHQIKVTDSKALLIYGLKQTLSQTPTKNITCLMKKVYMYATRVIGCSVFVKLILEKRYS